MRTIKGLPIPQDGNDTKFPDGQIRNETATETGTPVVREVYGDVLTNIYAILRNAGITPNQQEDGETTKYQLLDALKVFSNNLNDIQQLITIDGTEALVGFNFDKLPNNYVFIGQITEDFNKDLTYTLTGLGIKQTNLTSSSNVPASSVVLVVLNNSNAVLYNLVSLLEDNAVNYIPTPLGAPLTFGDSDDLFYFSNGVLMNDNPISSQITDSIREFESNAGWNVLDVVLVNEVFFAMSFNELDLRYSIYTFSINNLTTPLGEVTFDGGDFYNTYFPQMYSNGESIFFTNSSTGFGTSSRDCDLVKFTFDESNNKLIYDSSFSLNVGFEKTTNTFIKPISGDFYTLIEGELSEYLRSGEVKNFKGFFPTINGVLFNWKKSAYYSSEGVAVKWNL